MVLNMKAHITPALCRTAPPPERGRRKYDVYDTLTRGLVLEVRETGKTFHLRYSDGRKRQRQFTLGRYPEITAEQARRIASDLRARIAMGEDPRAEQERLRAIPTVAAYCDAQYLPDVRERLRSSYNVEVYARRFVNAIGSKALDEVTPAHVADLRRKLLDGGLSGATVNRHLAYLRALFNHAIKHGFLEGRNPAAAPNMLRETNRDVYLTPEETQRLVHALDQEVNLSAAAAILLMMLTGARRSEILRVRHIDLDLGRGLLTVPRSKNGRTRHIPLSPAAVQLLRAQARRAADGNQYVFPGKNSGEPLEGVRGPWERARKRARLRPDLRLHDLRHSFASALANAGVPINEIGAILGHRQLSTTTRYAHHAPQRLIQTASLAAKAWNLLPADAGAD